MAELTSDAPGLSDDEGERSWNSGDNDGNDELITFSSSGGSSCSANGRPPSP